MAWNNILKTEKKIKKALNEFNWLVVDQLCEELITRIRKEAGPMPEPSAKEIMGCLRRKRRFNSMISLGDDLFQSGLRSPQIRRQYSQALIDQGILSAAEMILQSSIQDPRGDDKEKREARGLMGRIYKQLYVNKNDPRSPSNRANLERSIKEYLYCYRLAPEQSLWHGINVVALAARARRDKLLSVGLPEVESLANQILDTLKKRERKLQKKNPKATLDTWDLATRMEAYWAINCYDEAMKAAFHYVQSRDADEFELASTIRQLTEVWQLNDKEEPGSYLLAVCKAAHLQKHGTIVDNRPERVKQESAAARDTLKKLEDFELEVAFSADAMVTVKWYKQGLEQCESIARIERPDGSGHGTGWLVNASDFFPDRQGVLLITNEHVISGDKLHPSALLPDEARINFEVAGQKEIEVDEIIWSNSCDGGLDATIVSLKSVPTARPLKIASRPLRMPEPPGKAPRLYIIGHPGGRELTISLQDNHLVACNDQLVHYRTPTEGGSSGSPVFENQAWQVVGLHHAGSKNMRHLDGKDERYEANEAIVISAIKKEIAKDYKN